MIRYCRCGSTSLERCRLDDKKAYLCKDCGFVFPKGDALQFPPSPVKIALFKTTTYMLFARTFDGSRVRSIG